MGSTQPFLRRAIALPIAAVLAAGSLIALTAGPASADNGVPPLDLSTQALPTMQVDGVVWSQTVVGNTVYVAGQFTTARPLAGGTVPRANVLAYNLTTGELITSFVANTNSAVRSIAASPDGSRVYIAGEFTTVNGRAHARVAALDAATGAPLSAFSPVLNSGATGVVATSSAAYVIGKFTQANGEVVSKAVAFNATSGALLNWRPVFGSGILRAVTMSPDRSIVLVGGSFTSVGSSHAGGMAALDARTGQLLPWAASSVVDLGAADDSTGIYGLSTDGAYVYGAGWAFKDKWGQNSLEGVVSMKWDTGAINWIEDCHGDSYSSSSMNGLLYVASHSHFCGNVPNGFGEMATNTGHRATAFSVKAAGVLAHNTEQGPGYYQDFGGQPAPILMNFFPDLAPGNYTGQGQAAWSVASSRNYVLYAGEFPTVNGAAQRGLVRFYEPATSPVDAVTAPTPTPTPTASPTSPTSDAKPKRVSTPNAVALGPSEVAVKWSAPKGAIADKVSGFIVKAYQGSKLVKTVTVGRTVRHATFRGLKRSTTYRVGVAAKNAQGIGPQSKLDPTKTRASGRNVSSTKHPSKVKKPTAGMARTKVRVRWAGASSAGALGIGRYEVRVLLHGKTVKIFTVGSRARSKVITGLKRHTGYTVSVRAGNWAGWGAWSVSRGAHTR